MKALFLTNLYPPVNNGGYEQWCQEVTEQLRHRGHEIVVLTSRHAREQLDTLASPWVQRQLHLEMEFTALANGLAFFAHRRRREQENLTILRRLIDELQPDVMLIWGMWNFSRALPVLAEQLLPGRVAYYIGDYWPTLPSQYELYWQAPARNWKTFLPKTILGLFARQILKREPQPVPQFAHALFPTAFIRDHLVHNGLVAEKTEVIYGAADTSLFVAAGARSGNGQENGAHSLLYAGRLRPDKGVHLAIEAMDILVHQQGLDGLRLTVVGGGDQAYVAALRDLVRERQLEAFVTFLPPQPKEMMPQIYHQADIFLFTSLWAEPFGRVLVEAMAAGTAVVGAATGGAAEILVEGENALTFPPGDARRLADQVARLIHSPALRQRLVDRGRRTAVERFDINRMAAEIEAYLQAMVTNG